MTDTKKPPKNDSSIISPQGSGTIYEGQPKGSSRQTKEIIEETNKLDDLQSKTERVIFNAKSIFPFSLFADEIRIDELKVTVIIRRFFKSEEVQSVKLQLVSSITIESNPWFATLRIVNKDDANRPLELHYLPKSEAVKARRIIQGLSMIRERGIDITKLSILAVRQKAEEIGKSVEAAK